MSKDDFNQFIENNPNMKKKEQEIDWNKQKTDWLEFIEDLYKKVDVFLSDYKDKIESKKIKKTITEDYIGRYDTSILELTIANRTVTFDPIGTLLIGTKGRIDLKGPLGTVRFILADKSSTGMKFTVTSGSNPKKEEDQPEPKIDWTWKIVDKNNIGMNYIELNENSFFDALMSVVNG